MDRLIRAWSIEALTNALKAGTSVLKLDEGIILDEDCMGNYFYACIKCAKHFGDRGVILSYGSNSTPGPCPRCESLRGQVTITEAGGELSLAGGGELSIPPKDSPK